MSRAARILAGTLPPGGATCLFPVVKELRRRPDVELQVIGYSHSAEIFREHDVEFIDLDKDSDDPVTEATVQEVASRYAPDLVMTGVFGPIEGGLDYWLIRAAQDQRIQSFGILDAWMNYAMRFADPVSGDPVAYLPDRLAVMDDQTVEELAAEGIPGDRVCVTGHPFLPLVRQRARDRAARLRHRKDLGARPGDRVIVFFSEPLRWGEQEGLNEPLGYDEFDAFRLLEAGLAQSTNEDILVVREHPRHASLQLPDRIDRTRVIRGREQRMLDLIQAADVVVGMSSTVLVYAYLAGQKVLVIQPGLRPDRDCNVLTRRGILPNLQTTAEVARTLAESSNMGAQTLQAVRGVLGWADRPDVRAAQCALQMCQDAGNEKHQPQRTASVVFPRRTAAPR